MKKTILIIDDDVKLNELLNDFFKNFGFNTLTAIHPEEGLKLLQEKGPDIIILDIMLPDMDGFEVCKKIRKTSTIPIVMLTARGDVTDKIVGLEIGADDYLAKPFEPRELVARIQSVLRRSSKNHIKNKVKFNRLEINFDEQSVYINEENLNFTTNEFQALALLVNNKGKVLNRDQILEHLRGIDCDAFNRSVDITMSRVRQKLNDDPKNPRYIKTIWGTGYTFIGSDGEDGEDEN